MAAVTPYDMLKKLQYNIAESTRQITRNDLKKIYMGDPSPPCLVSEHTFNEKIRTMCALEYLKPVTSAAAVFVVNWDNIKAAMIEWAKVFE